MVIKYRKNLLEDEENVRTLQQVLQEIAQEYAYVIDEIGIDKNHIHLFVWAWWMESPSRIMWTIKSLTAKKMLKLENVQKELWGWSFWSSWWYIGTVGDGTNEEVVRKYIQKQWINKQYYDRLKFCEL